MLGGMCYSRTSVNVNRYVGFQTAGIISHEIGHK